VGQDLLIVEASRTYSVTHRHTQ